MKTKKKLVLGGFVLVAIASVILFMSFGVPAKKSVPKGAKVIREYKPFPDQITALETNLYLAMINLRGMMLGIYNPLARCIKDSLAKAGIETIGIGIIPNLMNGRVYIYYNGIGYGSQTFRNSEATGGGTDTYYSVGIGYDEWHDRPGWRLIQPGSYVWAVHHTEDGDSRVWAEDDRLLCTFDTGRIREIVSSCLSKHELIKSEYGRIFVATNDGWVVINASGEVVACNDH